MLPVVTAITLVSAAVGAGLRRPSARRLRWLLPPTFAAGATFENTLWQRVALLAMALVVVAVLLNARHDRRRDATGAGGR